MKNLKLKRLLPVVLVGAMLATLFTGCEKKTDNNPDAGAKTLGNLVYESSMENEYAEQFSVDYYKGGYTYIETYEGDKLLVVPENAEEPENLPSDVVVFHQPAKNIYLAASATMALVNAIGGIDSVSLSGINANDWYTEEAKKAMDEGRLKYAGKYSEPDYELMLTTGCSLAIESTMIYHTPDVQEKLIELGIPVFVDLSSRESNPLGRMEWVKVYGIITGNEDKVEKFFDEKVAEVKAVEGEEPTGKTVAFFSINSSGLAVVRKTNDYVAKMIEIAGGTYIFDNVGLEDENSLSTVSMTMEEFYNTAVNADVIIYNSTIEGEINSIDDLINMNEVFKDFKAVKDGQVWCTDKNMYQATDAIADVIVDMRALLSGDADMIANMQYLKQLH
ncbi:MAG: ABC transporter substrate-binding protein [Lachnospiraceae bacterium]|nr:ABC transporter substrate-binding protein [Lachnospiraceae bacterium]